MKSKVYINDNVLSADEGENPLYIDKAVFHNDSYRLYCDGVPLGAISCDAPSTITFDEGFNVSNTDEKLETQQKEIDALKKENEEMRAEMQQVVEIATEQKEMLVAFTQGDKLNVEDR